jgi:hypothetical protein
MLKSTGLAVNSQQDTFFKEPSTPRRYELACAKRCYALDHHYLIQLRAQG